MKINSINTNTVAPQKNNFGMAYRVDNRWNEMFSTTKELEFISSLRNKANSGIVKYMGTNDGLTYRFKCPDGDIFFMKERKGLMPNVKFIPNSETKEGFYIINNGASEMERQFRNMTAALNNVIKSDYNKCSSTVKAFKHNPAYTHSRSYSNNYRRPSGTNVSFSYVTSACGNNLSIRS